MKISELFKIPGNKVLPGLEDEIEAVTDDKEVSFDAKEHNEEPVIRPAIEENTRFKPVVAKKHDQNPSTAKKNIIEVSPSSKGPERPAKR